jgi:hypothetical protein
MKPSSLKLANIDLVDREGIPTCPSTTVAGQCGIQHHAVLQLIAKHLPSIEGAFGPLAFEMRAQIRKANAGTTREYDQRIAYPPSCRRPLMRGLVAMPNRRRRRWPALVLSFLLGLIAGWVLRDGGAWLP